MFPHGEKKVCLPACTISCSMSMLADQISQKLKSLKDVAGFMAKQASFDKHFVPDIFSIKDPRHSLQILFLHISSSEITRLPFYPFWLYK